MVRAYKEHFQFIMIMTVMYVLGVWVNPTIYVVFPLVMLLFGIKKRFFEMFILTIWMLILSDYVPIKNATYDDLQFAKDLKPLLPIFLFTFFILFRHLFKPVPRLFLFFIPFFIAVAYALQYSINFTVGSQKTISFILMYLCIPIYVVYLHREQKELFWNSLMTFILGMLTIGMVLRFVAPDIAMLEGGGRYKGVLGNPNALGIFLNLTFMLWIIIQELGLARFTKKEKWYAVTVIFLSLIWSGTRNGIMSILLFYMVFRLVKINLFLAIIAVMAFVVYLDELNVVLIEGVKFFGLEDYFRLDSLEEGSGRKVAWAFAWTQIQDYFVFGGGFGHDEHIMRPNYYWLTREGHQGGVHNSYLSLWFDSGIVGVILYFLGLLGIMFRSFTHNYIMLAVVVSIAFNITYESWLVASLNPFTILYLIILTIFVSNLTGKDFEVEEDIQEVELEEAPQVEPKTA